MKYSYKLISRYIDGKLEKEELLGYLELLGLNPTVVEVTGDDTILELETPANRGDLLSLVGVAREVVPFTSFGVNLPDTGFDEKISERLPVRIENKNDCFYYSCRIVRDIDASGHPAWLKESIEKLGYRSSLSVVDISNYVMAETGQPLHIFDLDRIEGGITVRRAKKGETLVTIDGRKRDLDEGVMVIADDRKVVAIAGIMGGENSEVRSNTANILIESAVFNPVIVRRGSKRLGLATEASARFERGLDMEASRTGMARTVRLISEITGGDIGPLTEEGEIEERAEDIRLDTRRIARVAGLKIEKKFISGVLKKLNFTVKTKGGEYDVCPPPYRKDIREDVDVIEEIVKYRKYAEVPSELPCTCLTPTPSSKEIHVLEKVKDTAVKLGFTEVINMGLTSRENAEIAAMTVPAEIENPLSANLGFLRTSLIPEMLENAAFNINHEVKRLDIFELGKIYHNGKKSFGEKYNLAFVTVNSGDFLSLKGRIEKLLEKSGLKDVVCEMRTDDSFGEENLDVQVGEMKIGHIFMIPESMKTAYDMKNERIFAAEIFLESLIDKMFPADVSFRELPRYPSSVRDFSFVFPEGITWREIENLVISLNLPAEKVEFFDLYKGSNIPKGSISVSFSVIFRFPDRTPENEEVSGFCEKIVKAVCGNLKGRLRGENADV